MSRKLNTSIIIVALLILATLPLLNNAQSTVGCCCDPVVKNGSFSTAADCATLGFTFIGPPPSIAVTCSQFCNATLAPPPVGTCGDGICQSSESTTTCPGDCAPIVTGCGSPMFKPAPLGLNVTPVKGQKAMRLSFILPCPADYINVSRCEGTECTNFKNIAQAPSTTVFTDEDSELQFNKDYTYAVSAHYSISGDSEPAVATGNAGDLECWHQQSDKFCVNYFFYDQFYEYLTTFGYAQYNASEFTNAFGRIVNLTFATRFNQAWQCNERNLLIETSPKVSCDSKLNQYCISDENGPRCITREPCNVGFDPFGLFSTQDACEKGLFSRYCFFDRSKTNVNKCYSCDPRMTCYDYKSKTACEKDNCGAGDCQWNPVIEDLGIGVCTDKRYNNCKLCNSTGTPGIENNEAASSIWDSCSEEKSTALSTINYPCFYDKDKKVSKTCDEATCADYTGLQCGSPPEGIKLNPDNSLAEPSTDICKIKVCEYHLTTGCVKNADGNTGAGFQDCKYGDKKCEQDYFPPITTLIPTGTAGRVDFLDIRIFDKINSTSPPVDFAGKQGYRVYLCAKNATNSCSDSRTFSIATNSTRLILKNTLLKDGNKTLAKLSPGNNTLAYYGRDAANNLELLKEMNVYACQNCNGPTLLNLTVTGGRVIGKSIYTSAVRPTFTLTFDEPTQVTFAEISRPGESISLSQLTLGALEMHQFVPISDLLGTYNFTINGHNSQNIYFDPPGLQYTLVIDPELAGLTITPADGSIINKTTVDIELNFTRPVTLKNVMLVSQSFGDPYVIKETKQDITNLFKTTTNYTYSAKSVNSTGGKYTIVVQALGFNGLDIYKQSSFFVATQKPSIRLVTPTFGVTAYSFYNTSIETPIPGQCAYVYDVPSAPNPSDFEFFKAFEGTGTIHTTTGLTINYGDTSDHQLHTYCKFENFGIVQRSFNISLDPDPPTIIKAFAEPPVIAEQYTPNQEIYVTTLNAQLDKPGFCKYSLITSSFDAMEGIFPGFDFTPKQSLGADVNVTEKKAYQYYVTCKGKNQLTSKPAQIPFTVDLTLPLSVTSNTPQGFGTLNFTIGVVANKRVFCYFGERADDTTKCMGACTSGYTQWQKITVSNSGEFTYYVKCAHVSGEQSDIIEIPVIIDTTPPTMNYVKDDSILPDPQITWSQTKIRVAFKAEDPESNISHYLVTLQDQTSKQIVFKDYVSNVTDGEPFYISTTANGSKFRLNNNRNYNFKVKAVNAVGLESDVMESDGVKVDITQVPGQCINDEVDQNESDVDCGGPCNGCPEGKKCNGDLDCETNYCQSGVCKVAACDDGARNGLESDVDCGGQACIKCANERVCIRGSDCESGYCDIKTDLCTDAPPCADKVLTPGETDIDCGGPCERCLEGKTCQESIDCAEGLNCKPDTKICTTEPIGDEDLDTVPDDKDKCPGTQPGETADENGCGPSQKFSLGDDINDGWRMKYFNCIDCPEAVAGADPDKDGLTNLDEFKAGTDPTKKDTDGDRWNDKKEIEKGTDPTNPASHPPSIFLTVLWVLFILLVVGAFGYGILIVIRSRKERKPAPAVPPKEEAKEILVTKEEELAKLKTFAKEEELPEKDWISLEKEIKRKPLPPKKFEEALEKLRKIAHKERIRPEEPLLKLRALLDEITSEERKELLSKFRMLKAGLLTKEEREELFRRLKITAEYYRTHKEELERELEHYGKHKKR